MRLSTLSRITVLAAGLAAFPSSGDVDQILQVARATWPGSHTIGIVCDFRASGESIRAMLASFPPGSTVRVVDLRAGSDTSRACSILANLSPHYVLLLPDDPLVHDGSFQASMVVNRMNGFQIPTLATTPAALKQGAWAVMGPATGNLLQVNPALQGYVEAYGTPIVPARPLAKAGDPLHRATITVVAGF